MGLEIAIMYVDLSIRRVPIADIETLPTTGVLFISLSSEWGNRSALVSRRSSRRNQEGKIWHGDDNYAVGFLDDKFFIYQWDDFDEILFMRPVASPHDEPQELPRPIVFPKHSTVYKFKGGYVDMPTWEIALAKFEAEMF